MCFLANSIYCKNLKFFYILIYSLLGRIFLVQSHDLKNIFLSLILKETSSAIAGFIRS